MLYDSVTDATVHHIFVMGFRGSLSLCRAILKGLAQEFEGVSCAWSLHMDRSGTSGLVGLMRLSSSSGANRITCVLIWLLFTLFLLLLIAQELQMPLRSSMPSEDQNPQHQLQNPEPVLLLPKT